MSFKNMFNSSEEKDSNENKINWNELTDLGQLSEIIQISNENCSHFQTQYTLQRK
jgi:hypothetical protein